MQLSLARFLYLCGYISLDIDNEITKHNPNIIHSDYDQN